MNLLCSFDENNQLSIVIDNKPSDISEEDSNFMEEFAGHVLSSMSESIDQAAKYALDHKLGQQMISKPFFVIDASYSYFRNLKEQKKDGYDGYQDHAVALGQTAAGLLLGAAATAAVAAVVAPLGLAAGTAALVSLGAGITLGIVANKLYEAKIFDNNTASAKDKLGEFIAGAFDESQPDQDQIAISTYDEINVPYDIKDGDTLSQIADDHNISLQDLLDANPQIIDPNLINVGDQINIPTTLEELFDMKNLLEQDLQQSLSNNALSDILQSLMDSLLSAEDAQIRIRRRDPLTFDLDGDGLELISLEDSTAFFDMDGNGIEEQVGWVSSDDGLLVYDSNGNGVVDNINELFGKQGKTFQPPKYLIV